MQSLTFTIFMVSKKIAVLMFLIHKDTWPAGLTLISIYTQSIHVSQKTLCEISFLEC